MRRRGWPWSPPRSGSPFIWWVSSPASSSPSLLSRRKNTDAFSERRVGEPNEVLPAVFRRVKPQEPHRDSRCPLHVAGLRNEQLGADAVFRLHPTQALFVARPAGEQVGGHLLRERDIRRIRLDAMQVEEELRDARGA